MKSKYFEDLINPWQNIFKDRTLPYFSHLQHPLQHDPTHPAHPAHPENPLNVSIHLDPSSLPPSPPTLPTPTHSRPPSPRSARPSRPPSPRSARPSLPSSPSTPTLQKDPPLHLPVHEKSSTGLGMGILLESPSLPPSSSPNPLKEEMHITKDIPMEEFHALPPHDEHHTIPPFSPLAAQLSHQDLHAMIPDHALTLHSDPTAHHEHSGVALIGGSTGSAGTPKTRSRDLGLTTYIKKKLHKLKNRLHSNIPKVRAKVEKITVDGIFAQTVVIPFLLEFGRALHICGVPAHRLEYELTLVAASFGIDGNYFYTPTGIFCSFGDPSTVLSPYTHLIRVGGADFDLEKLCLLEELALDISQKRLNCAEGISAIHAIMSLPPRYPRLLVILSIIFSSFAIAIMFGLGWTEVGITSLAGLYVAIILYISEKVPPVGRVVEAVSGLGCGFIASIFSSYVVHINMFIVALGGVIWFVPGLSITLAVSELATRNLISGTTRLMSAFSSILQLTFGIEAGVKLGDVFLHAKAGSPTVPLPPYWNYAATLICAIAFSILLRVPPKQMWAVFIASYVGTIGGQYGTQWLGNAIGAFIGAFLICVFGNLYARIVQRSVSAVPIIAGILLLVPGSLGVKALNALANNDAQTGIGNFGAMFQTAMSLTMGLLTANLLIRPYKAL